MAENKIDETEQVDQAKDKLLRAAQRVDPLRPLRQHPYTTVGVAAVSGFLMGSGSHPAIMKTLRLSMSLVGLAKPAVLLAGKFAASHFAKQSVGEVEPSSIPTEGSA